MAGRHARPQPTSPEDPGVRGRAGGRASLLPRLTHLEGEGGEREAAEPRGPGVGRSRGWSVAVSGTRGYGGLWGGTGSRLGLSRGLSEPARPRDRPKISDTFSPKPHTDSAGGDTENIFFLFLPPHPPTSLPARLPPPLPPSLLPPLPPAPAWLPPWCPRAGGQGGGGLGGAAQDAWVSAPPICWASVAPSPGGRARLAEEVSVLSP